MSGVWSKCGNSINTAQCAALQGYTEGMQQQLFSCNSSASEAASNLSAAEMQLGRPCGPQCSGWPHLQLLLAVLCLGHAVGSQHRADDSQGQAGQLVAHAAGATCKAQQPCYGTSAAPQSSPDIQQHNCRHAVDHAVLA